MTAVLRGAGLGHAFGANPVLQGVDAALEPGSLLGVVGPNGAGKTTLVRALSGVLAPDSGSVELAGTPLRGRSRRDVARVLAVVPQDAAIPFPFTVTEVVAMGRAPFLGPLGRDGDSDRQIVTDAIGALGLAALAERSFPTLSGGEKQRVMLARAFAQTPRVLLLDEPVAHMDLGHRIKTLEILRRWLQESRAGQERAALLVTHDLSLAARHSDAVLLLAGGRVVATGAPEHVLTQERIGDVYGVDAAVSKDAEGRLVIVARKSRIDYTPRLDEPDH